MFSGHVPGHLVVAGRVRGAVVGGGGGGQDLEKGPEDSKPGSHRRQTVPISAWDQFKYCQC